jgi:membrane protein implicated in regulation of membrane protease activity
MSNATFWWLLAGAMVALELFTGTFYLLMLTIGLSSAALAAHAGFGLTGQLLIGAIVGSAAVVGWHFKKLRQANGSVSVEPSEMRLDVGEMVHIEQWLADGTAKVHYRGAKWDAVHRPGVTPGPGQHRVAELIGNRLLVDKV